MATAEAETEVVEEQAEKKGGGFIPLIIVAVVSAGLGFCVPMLLPSGEVEDVPEADPDMQVDLPEPKGTVAFVEFQPVVVNLNDAKMTRYLKLVFSLQVDGAQKDGIALLLEEKTAIIVNWLNSHLSDLSMEEIRGKAAQSRLRREISDYFNTTLFPDGVDRIHDVLFLTFNIQ